MPSVPAYRVSPASRRPVPAAIASALTACAALATLAMPAMAEGASLWRPLLALFPESAASCFALGTALTVGCTAGLCADAAIRRRAMRPALRAAICAAMASPPVLAVPLWPALLAAAALVALPTPQRPRAANDNAGPPLRRRYSRPARSSSIAAVASNARALATASTVKPTHIAISTTTDSQ